MSALCANLFTQLIFYSHFDLCTMSILCFIQIWMLQIMNIVWFSYLKFQRELPCLYIYILSPWSTAVIPGPFFYCSTRSHTVCDLFTQAIFKVNCSQCRNIMLVYMQMYLVYSNWMHLAYIAYEKCNLVHGSVFILHKQEHN